MRSHRGLEEEVTLSREITLQSRRRSEVFTPSHPGQLYQDDAEDEDGEQIIFTVKDDA